jgi:hypothetical protein
MTIEQKERIQKKIETEREKRKDLNPSIELLEILELNYF